MVITPSPTSLVRRLRPKVITPSPCRFDISAEPNSNGQWWLLSIKKNYYFENKHSDHYCPFAFTNFYQMPRRTDHLIPPPGGEQLLMTARHIESDLTSSTMTNRCGCSPPPAKPLTAPAQTNLSGYAAPDSTSPSRFDREAAGSTTRKHQKDHIYGILLWANNSKYYKYRILLK